MQLQLPIFPLSAVMITPSLGFYLKDDIVTYLLNGLPIDSHPKDSLKSFRYTTAKLVVLGLCRQVDIVKSFGVSEDSVIRSVKLYKEKGVQGFFEEDGRHGKCHKMLPDRLERIQNMLDKGMSNYSIAKKEKIAEGTIRYALQQGYLKKK
jgi:transposase